MSQVHATFEVANGHQNNLPRSRERALKHAAFQAQAPRLNIEELAIPPSLLYWTARSIWGLRFSYASTMEGHDQQSPIDRLLGEDLPCKKLRRGIQSTHMWREKNTR